MNWVFTYINIHGGLDTMVYRNQTLHECIFHFLNWEEFRDLRIVSIVAFD